MNTSQQALWTLEAGQALSLPIGPGARELSVRQGRLWLTVKGSLQVPAQDIWLAAGESLSLAAGSQVLIEAWPQAAFQLLVPPSACQARRTQRAAQRLPTARRFFQLLAL
jgi:hypothetical protein